MILTDRDIRHKVARGLLLVDYDAALIKYCGYELRAGKIIKPKSGRIEWVRNRARVFFGRPPAAFKLCVIAPSDSLVVVTQETLRIPADICATYGQLNRLAAQGLMLLNTSIVEPGYEGPLSCVLVNFSSRPQALSPGDPIAKINFHRLTGKPLQLQKRWNRDEYEKMARKNAMNLPKSLLDIAGLEERVSQKVGSQVRKSITFASIFIIFLLLWSQLEGVISPWIFDRTGLKSTATQVELKLEQQRQQYEKENQALKNQIEELKLEVKSLKNASGGRSGPRR
jgi:deoxycytidine triphosphate deaminase